MRNTKLPSQWLTVQFFCDSRPEVRPRSDAQAAT